MGNVWIRDTLVREDELSKLPEANVVKIKELIQEYNSINYIDVRTQLGPDQVRRMSEKQRAKLSDNASRVFGIEMQIKQLLKSEDQVRREHKERRAKELSTIISDCESGVKRTYSYGRMIYTKNGKLKIGYARVIEDYERQISEAKKELETLNQ